MPARINPDPNPAVRREQIKTAFEAAKKNKMISGGETKQLEALCTTAEDKAFLRDLFNAEKAANPNLKVAKAMTALLGQLPPVAPGGEVVPQREVHGAVKGAVALPIPASLKDVIVDVDQAMTLEAAKRLDSSQQLLEKPSDHFRNFLKLNPGKLLPEDPALAPLKAALNVDLTVVSEGCSFQVEPGKFGARMVFFNDNHEQLKKLLHDPAYADGIFFKDMHHFDSAHVEGEAETFFQGDKPSFGTTHRGQLIPTMNKDGKPDICWVDWPTNYGRLSSGMYGAGINYWSPKLMEFKNGRPTDEQIRSLVQNMRTMSVLQMMVLPFSSSDANALYTDYHFNPLELRDDSKIKEYVEITSNPMDAQTAEKAKHFSMYCAEGAWSNSNTPPINKQSVERGLISPEAFERLKKMELAFNEAPGSNEDKWKALVAKGLLSQSHLDKVSITGALNLPFVLAKDDVKPLGDYEPVGWVKDGVGKGVNARPVSLAGLISGFMEVNFSREKISAKISEALTKAVQQTPQLLGIAAAVAKMDPASAADPANTQKIILGFGKAMATGYICGILSSDKLKATIQTSIRYDKMDPESQAKVDALIKEYVTISSDIRQTKDELATKLRELDKKAEETTVKYPAYNVEDKMMVFVPPHHSMLVNHGAGGAAMPGMVPVGYALHESYRTVPQ